MRQDALEQSTERPASGEDPYATFVARSARDERAIKLVGHLLIGGVAVERQVMALVRARSRS